MIMGMVSYGMLQILDDVFDLNTFLGIFAQGFFAGMTGIFAGILLLVFIKNEEIHTVWKTLHSKIWKARFVVVKEESL
jgi:hypothetical protein